MPSGKSDPLDILRGGHSLPLSGYPSGILLLISWERIPRSDTHHQEQERCRFEARIVSRPISETFRHITRARDNISSPWQCCRIRIDIRINPHLRRYQRSRCTPSRAVCCNLGRPSPSSTRNCTRRPATCTVRAGCTRSRIRLCERNKVTALPP